MGNYWCTYTFVIDGKKISVVAKDSDEADRKLKKILEKGKKDKAIKEMFQKEILQWKTEER